ncbi:MAG: hypothetical protein AB1578_20950 [Thermodesulfobacteriota bacterium]
MNDLDALVTAVVDRLRTAFAAPAGAVATVEEYPRLRTKLLAPALLVDVADVTAAPDPGTDELALVVRLEAAVVLDRAPTAPGVSPERAALALAAAVAREVYAAGRFGVAASPARELRIEPGDFKPDVATYAVWVVSWVQEVRLGSSVWDGEGVIPTQVWAGLSPEIGLPHEADYVEVTR